MKKPMPLTDADGEVRELTQADMARFRPAREVLSPELQQAWGMRVRGPQKAPVKQATTIRLDADVMAAFKATGKGWQTRINAVLREAVAAGTVAAG